MTSVMDVFQADLTVNQSTMVSPTEDPVFSYWYQYYTKQGEHLYRYGFPLFLIVGVFGNILSIILMTRGTFKQMSSGVYLLLLSISDLIVCAMGIADWFPETVFGFSISSNAAVCKGTQYLGKLFEQISSWMIVAVTMERSLIMIRPRLAWIISTRKMSWIVSAVIVTVLALINIYQPFIVGIVRDGGCFFVKQFDDHLVGIAFALTDLLLYSLIPSIILISCNAALAIKLNERRKLNLTVDIADTTVTCTKKIIVMVITISIVFVFLTLPYSCFIISDFIPPGILYIPTTRELWFYIVSLLVTVNHSINIFLYFLTFRQEFWDIFKCFKCSGGTQVDDNLQSTTTLL